MQYAEGGDTHYISGEFVLCDKYFLIMCTRIMQWFVSLVKRLVEVSLQVQRCRGYAIGEHYALPVEVGEVYCRKLFARKV